MPLARGALGPLYISGAFGVDLFFTLSGYLLTSLLLREREQTNDIINVSAFYVRRTLRIWPLYYFSLVLAFLLTRIPGIDHRGTLPTRGDLFLPIQGKSYFFMATFLFNFNIAGSLATNQYLFMNHLWSISVGNKTVLPVLAVVCSLRSAPAHRDHSDTYDCSRVHRARDSAARHIQTRLDLHLHSSRSDCGGNFDSACAEDESAACSSPGARAGWLRQLGVCRILLLDYTNNSAH